MLKQKLLYVRYEITGLNREYLLNALAKRNIAVYHVKKVQKNKIRLTVSAASQKKLFAFLSGSCYNVKKVRTFGLARPLLLLRARIGIACGIAAFLIAVSVLCNVMADVRYTGSGAVYSGEIQAVLAQNGVRRFGFFLALDYENLEKKIFASGRFSFVSVSRSGSRLVVRTELAGSPPDILDRTATAMHANCDGVVVSLKVLRGTPVVKVGDSVRAGDLIVDGNVTVGEQQMVTPVLATLVLRCTKTVECPAAYSEQQRAAERIFACESIFNGAVTDCVGVEDGDRYIITVTYEIQQFGG